MCSNNIAASAAFAVVVALVGACGSKAAPASTIPTADSMPVPTVQIGDCADPERDGVIGDAPQLRRADRDLNGDEVAEAVVADRTMCTEEGNCHWNVFVGDGADGCSRYAGTIAAAAIESLQDRGEGGFFALRGWWSFAGGSRMLMQEYQFRHGGYHVRDAVMCRQVGGDRLICQPDGGEW
jgi:hypothetical protein